MRLLEFAEVKQRLALNPWEKLIKVRKPHICQLCETQIHKGSRAILGERKDPKLDDDEKQIGIHYLRYYLHGYDCENKPLISSKEDQDDLATHRWYEDYRNKLKV